MRVVLRHQENGFYLQPSGEWGANRETAREFLSAVVAYWWALEQKLIRAEVLLAMSDPQKDFVAIRIEAKSSRPVIDCSNPDWNQLLHSHLYNNLEVDLVEFDCSLHGEACELLAQAFQMDFTLDRDPETRTAHFRKKAAWRVPWRG